MLVAEVYSIKVFSPDGTEKIIIGRQGEGPGEFMVIMDISASDEGFLSVVDNEQSFKLFSSEYSYMYFVICSRETKLLELKKRFNYTGNFLLRRLKSVSAQMQVLQVTAVSQYKNPVDRIITSNLILYNNGDFTHITDYFHESIGDRGIVPINPSNKNTVYKSYLYSRGFETWDILPGNKLIVTHPVFDAYPQLPESRYILRIFGLESLKEDRYSIPYKPIEISRLLNSGNYISDSFLKKWMNYDRYLPPLIALKADRNFAFLFHYTDYPLGLKEGVVLTYPVDILDVDAEKIIASAEFPFIPDVIRNGFAYRLYRPVDDFPRVEKYRINPAVYGK
jgi:hypothetical protein